MVSTNLQLLIAVCFFCQTTLAIENLAAIEPEINCTDDSNFLCDGVCTQSTKLKEDIVVAFDRGNVGWKMVYNFMVFMDENCGRAIDVGSYSQVRVQLTRYTRYDPNMRCELFLTTRYGSRMMVYFDNIDIEKDRLAVCHYDYLEVDDGSTTQYPYIAGGRLCGDDKPEDVYTTSGSDMTLYFKSDDGVQKSGFDLIVTSYHTGYCEKNFEYVCNNGYCIDSTVVCSGYNSCGDNSDCNNIAVLVGSVCTLVGAILSVITFCLVRKRKSLMKKLRRLRQETNSNNQAKPTRNTTQKQPTTTNRQEAIPKNTRTNKQVTTGQQTTATANQQVPPRQHTTTAKQNTIQQHAATVLQQTSVTANQQTKISQTPSTHQNRMQQMQTKQTSQTNTISIISGTANDYDQPVPKTFELPILD